jgi:membrane protease YdiL (CAAX protease family)
MTELTKVPARTRESEDFRHRLRGFGPVGILAIALVLGLGDLVGPVLALLWARVSRTPLKALGFVASRSWLRDVVMGLLSGVALKILLKAVLLPPLGVPPLNHTYNFLVDNTAALPRILVVMIIGGGFGEETVWRGFLFERLRALLGTSRSAATAIVVSSALLFASAHLFDQGWPGAIQAVFTGSAFGIAYWRLGRIWPIMVAHAAYDVTAVLLIYWKLESVVAHMVFK